jgi:hypothetical protein
MTEKEMNYMTEHDPLKILTEKELSDGVAPEYTTENIVKQLRLDFPPPRHEVGYFPELEYNYWISFNFGEIDTNDIRSLNGSSGLRWKVKNIQSTGKELVVRVMEARLDGRT